MTHGLRTSGLRKEELVLNSNYLYLCLLQKVCDVWALEAKPLKEFLTVGK